MFTRMYRPRIAALALILVVMALTMSCGGAMGVGLRGTNGSNTGLTGDSNRSAGLIRAVAESEIGTLPARQQKLLCDPGWNQPYITPPAGTPVTPPDLSSLVAQTERALAQGVKLNPRFAHSAAKGASWYGDSSGPFSPPIEVGEYEALPPGGKPAYGCNNDTGNASLAGHAIEDLIAATAASSVLPVNCISYVREGLCSKNYFNTLVGANKNASAAVYQAYCSIADGSFDPLDPPASAQAAEISYRSSLVPNGGSVCAATAYLVSDYFWRAFNRDLRSDQIPGGPVATYNVLIAPSGPQSADFDSPGNTTGAYQPFYFGTMSTCYGGAWIVGLKASMSSCPTFRHFFDTQIYQPDFWHKPIYGILLQRWQDMALVDGQPWTSEMGWPTYGPIGASNGALQLSSKGAFYQWGMYFERGFIWWIDYDQSMYPSVPDESQAYNFSGSNVFCAEQGDKWIKAGPTQFYGGSGTLGVNVSVDGMRLDAVDPWQPVSMNAEGTLYHVLLPDPGGLGTVDLLMHARGYGGTPNAAGHYKTYVWAFRDGTVQPAGADYDDTQRTAVHTYGDAAQNREMNYIVRVQVQDEIGFAYGDSLPIGIGHPPGGGADAEILVIRDDAPGFNTYNTNLNALLSDLDACGALYTVVNYSPTVAADFVAGGYQVAIWYRGGPGDASEPDYTTPWTAEEEAAFNTLLGYKMLLISQAHGSVATTYSYSYWGWDDDQDSQHCRRINSVLMEHATDQNMGLASNEDNGVFGWLYVMFGSEMGAGQATTNGPQRLGVYNSNSAECNLATGSSGKKPIRLTWGAGGTDVLQFCGRGWQSMYGATWINPGWNVGMCANPISPPGQGDETEVSAYLSYGCASSGGTQWNIAGPGRFWCWAMPYTKLEVTASSPLGMTRADVLQNVLAWLDSTLTLYNAGEDHWRPYHGDPEIISVRPGYWETSPAGYAAGQESLTGVDYPDPASTDVYRTDYVNAVGERFISTTTPGNNGLDFADLDFQFSLYAYITTNSGGVETSPADTAIPPVLATDDTVAFRGLLVSDADQNWARYTPPAGELPNVLINYGPPLPAVAGYFFSTTGNSGDEQYASYGTADPVFTWDNIYPLEVEALAHWPTELKYGVKPARLYWSMYPGHRMLSPGTGTLLNNTTDGWYGFRRIFDIDPTENPSGRDSSSWNAAQFQYSSLSSEGRVVSFNYRSIVNWNPDLNYDRDSNTAGDGPVDKFPIRCRLFTEYNTYIDSDDSLPGIQPYVWPNNQPPKTSYVEGGCYVVDKGEPTFPVFRIIDDPTHPDPADHISGGGGSYQITFQYILENGIPQYDIWVEFDPALNETWSGPGTYIYHLASGINEAGVSGGVLFLSGIACPPAGSYWITLKGTDGAVPHAVDYYTYDNKQLVIDP